MGAEVRSLSTGRQVCFLRCIVNHLQPHLISLIITTITLITCHYFSFTVTFSLLPFTWSRHSLSSSHSVLCIFLCHTTHLLVLFCPLLSSYKPFFNIIFPLFLSCSVNLFSVLYFFLSSLILLSIFSSGVFSPFSLLSVTYSKS